MGDYDDSSFNVRCTGVEIGDYRIDVSKDDWSDGSWGCTADYTVYRKDNSELTKVAETGPISSSQDIKLDGLTIDAMSANSGIQFYSCQWVQTGYEIDDTGELQFNISSQTKAERGQPLPVQVEVINRYDRTVYGDLKVDFKTRSAFGQTSSLTKTKQIELTSGDSQIYEFDVNLTQVGDEIIVKPTVDLMITKPDNWVGVNTDCNNDGVIEPIQDCNDFSLGEKEGTTQNVEVVDEIQPTDEDEDNDGNDLNPFTNFINDFIQGFEVFMVWR